VLATSSTSLETSVLLSSTASYDVASITRQALIDGCVEHARDCHIFSLKARRLRLRFRLRLRNIHHRLHLRHRLRVCLRLVEGASAAPVNHGVTAGKPKIAVGAPSKARRCTVAVSKPALKAPGTKRLKLKCDEPLSNCAFNFNMRRYSKDGNTGFFGADGAGGLSNHRAKVGRCRLAVSKPKLKAGLVSALDTIM